MPHVPDNPYGICCLGLAELVAHNIFKLDPTSMSTLSLQIYMKIFGDGINMLRVRSETKGKRLEKQPGCSLIEVKNYIHIFIARERSYHQLQEIYDTLESLTVEMKRAGKYSSITFNKCHAGCGW